MFLHSYFLRGQCPGICVSALLRGEIEKKKEVKDDDDDDNDDNDDDN